MGENRPRTKSHFQKYCAYPFLSCKINYWAYVDFTVFFNTLDGVLKAKTDTPAFEASLHLPGLYGAQGSQQRRQATGLCDAMCFSLLCLLTSWPSSPSGAAARLEENPTSRREEGRGHSGGTQHLIRWSGQLSLLCCGPPHVTFSLPPFLIPNLVGTAGLSTSGFFLFVCFYIYWSLGGKCLVCVQEMA